MTEGMRVTNGLFDEIYKLLGVKTQLEAAEELGVFQSAISDCKRRGIISDRIYVALAKKGIDIRNFFPKKTPDELLDFLARTLSVNKSENDIAKALGLRVSQIKRCIYTGVLTDEVCVALARHGYDIRKFFSED